jgi:type IV pilus assembly protein PilB
MNILDILLQKKIIEERERPQLEQEIRANKGDIEGVLRRHGINAQEILSAKATLYGIPVRNMENQTVPFEVLKYVAQDAAQAYGFVPIGIADNVLDVGILDPDNIEARDALNFISSKLNMPYRLFLLTQDDFNRVIEMYNGYAGQVSEALNELNLELLPNTPIGQKDDVAGAAKGLKDLSDTLPKGTDVKIIEQAPASKIVNTILAYAVEGSASDIHIEPVGDTLRVRYRVDGVLNTTFVFPIKSHAALVTRIKILSSIRLDEKRKPQDGRFQGKFNGRAVDFRVSTFPTYYGEKVEIRILDTQKGLHKLNELGLSERNLGLILSAIKRPFGMILISGPTGSGKSTTLYSMLNEVDHEHYNVVSLEDPVEYTIPGVNQSQVRADIGYDFASGLRSILRQDPDIMMVGEIRDKETAELAVQAALTGHLVFSTIHTNDAVGVIPRLVDLGVDPFLIGPTLVLAIAQRLVRKIAPGCGKAIPIDGSAKALIESKFKDLPDAVLKKVPFGDKIYTTESMPQYPSGTSGRMAVMEVLEMDKDVERLITAHPSELDIARAARKQGMLSLQEDAIIKAFKGEIPFEQAVKLGASVDEEVI